ncbi:MAG TPA: poly-gamma-glutamate biosynthesis protein PgsC [Candidatus Bathyarchaeia archaeon]
MVFPAVNSQILTIGVFIGIVVSMIFYERELLSPGGVVVPGYTALFLITNPIIVVYTLLIALLTALIISRASRFTILFGRRRFAVTMLLALTLSLVANALFGLLAGPFPYLFTGPYSYQGFQVIGIIIPGLIANELHRQGIGPTLATLGTVSVITAIILYVIVMLV